METNLNGTIISLKNKKHCHLLVNKSYKMSDFSHVFFEFASILSIVSIGPACLKKYFTALTYSEQSNYSIYVQLPNFEDFSTDNDFETFSSRSFSNRNI